MPRIIWAEPVVALVNEFRAQARSVRETIPQDLSHAGLLESAADRLEAAILRGAELEYVDTAEAARFFRVSEEAMRARCRRSLSKKGKARRRGGKWEIHASVLEAA